MRRGLAWMRKSGRTARRVSSTTSATPLRIARISKMLSPPRDSWRIETAMTENESNAPTIQRTTRASLLLITGRSSMSEEPG